MSRVLIAVLLLSVLTGDAALNEAGNGRLLDAYALADGSSVVVTLFNNAYSNFLILRYNYVGGGFNDQRLELPSWQSSLPLDSLTEICGGRLHVWLGWGEQDSVLHYAWDLPIAEIQQLHLPLICRER